MLLSSLLFVILLEWFPTKTVLEEFRPLNGKSCYFTEEILSLYGISPSLALLPPHPHLSHFLTLQILEQTEWASLFIGPLKDLLKGSAMNGRWGWGSLWGLGYMLYVVTVGQTIHHRGREAGSSPRTSMQQQGQAPALVTPGPRRWVPCPF